MQQPQETSLQKLIRKFSSIELLKTNQVMEILQISRSTISRLVKEKYLNKYYLDSGRKQSVRFDKEQVFGLIKKAFID